MPEEDRLPQTVQKTGRYLPDLANAELMLQVLARARQHRASQHEASKHGTGQHAGSIADYLAGHGVTCAELAALRSALVTQRGTR